MKKAENKTYILTYKARRKDAKRHIFTRSNDIEYLRRIATNEHFDFEIYSGDWKQLIEKISTKNRR